MDTFQSKSPILRCSSLTFANLPPTSFLMLALSIGWGSTACVAEGNPSGGPRLLAVATHAVSVGDPFEIAAENVLPAQQGWTERSVS